jgi:hypothetical protein
MAKIPHVPPTPSSAPSTPGGGVAAPNAARPLPIDVELVKAAQASGDEELARAVQLFVEDWKNRGPEKSMGPKQAFLTYVKKVGNDSSLILAQKLGQFMGVNTKMFDQLGGVGPVNAGDAAAPSQPSPPAAINPAASQPAPAAKGKGGDSLPGGMKFSEAAAVIFRDGVGKLPPEVAADIASDPKKMKSVQRELSGLHFNPKAMNPLVAQDGKLSGGDRRSATVQDYAPASPDKAKAAQSDLIYQVLTHRFRAEKRAQGVPFPEEPELDPEVVAEFERVWSGLKGDAPENKKKHALEKTEAAAAKLVANGSPPAGSTTQPTPPTNVQSNLDAAVGNQNIVNGPAVADPAPTPKPKDPAPAQAAVAQEEGPPSQEAAKPQAQATPEANPTGSPPPNPTGPPPPNPWVGTGSPPPNPKSPPPPSPTASPSTWVGWMKRNKLLTATGVGAAGLGAAYLLNQQYPDNRSQQSDRRMPQPGPAGGPGTDSLPPLWSDQLQDESLDDYLRRRARSSGMSGNAPGLPFHVGATAGRYGS